MTVDSSCEKRGELDESVASSRRLQLPLHSYIQAEELSRIADMAVPVRNDVPAERGGQVEKHGRVKSADGNAS